MSDISESVALPALRALVGQSGALRAAVTRALMAAGTPWPVLITGESGTGKELFARLIHEAGPCAAGPFVTVNCGTLPRELAESELFGHERGAFTGAGQRRIGWFEEAAGGTLVLDEIGELPLELQPKLLRVLETQRFRRIGGQGEIACQVRVVASTLRDLAPEGGDGGRVRLDLYHRLEGLSLALPALRERREDIPLLVESFGREAGWRLVLDEAGWGLLGACAWPGNVRQLRNVIRRAILFTCAGEGRARPEPADVEGTNMRGPSATSSRAGAADGRPPPTLAVPATALREALAAGGGASPARYEAGRAALASSTGDPKNEAADRACEGESSPSDVPPTSARGPVAFGARTIAAGRVEPYGHVLDLRDRTFADIERAVMAYALARHAGSRRRAARSLAIPKSTFSDRVRRYGLA
jgi:DNA-binding NtrC family response regulator